MSRLNEFLVAISPPSLTQAAVNGRALLRDQAARRRVEDVDRLHLACGTNVMDGWANVDMEGDSRVIKLDLTRPLPFRSGSFRYVYSEHFIEHIERDEAQNLLVECHRVLQPGGVLRVSTPDLAVLVSEYAAQGLNYWDDMHWHPASPCRLLNEGMRFWGHRFLFDAAELQAAMRGAGFREVVACGWRESAHEALRSLECRPFHRELIYDCAK